jgi:zinc/manganese transport system substrate-binding protein
MSKPDSRRTLRTSTAILAMMVGLGACSNDGGGGGIAVVATTSILADIASNVVGDEGTVEFLVPLGGDAHDFSPSAQQVARLTDADLVVANGLNLEEGLVDVLESVKADGTEVVELAALVDPLPFSSTGHENEDEHGSEDPHFWMDPIRVGTAALAVAEFLEESNPGGGWLERADIYVQEMESTDETISALLEDVPEENRKMVTNHEAFGYFAHRYGFEIVGVIILGGSTLAEPSSAELAELVEVMDNEGVRVIFAETSQPTTLADAVAAELGDHVEVIELFTGSLGLSGSGAETLAGMLLTNAERIASSLA